MNNKNFDECKMNIANNKRRLGCIFLCAMIVAGVFVIVFSKSTSFLYPYFQGYDSPTYFFVGKSWARGSIPYKDIFMDKGALIYFVDMLGYIVTGNRYGVIIFQTIFMMVTIVAIYAYSGLICKKNFSRIGIVLLVLLSLTLLYEEGNLVEEYFLPFLFISIYFQSKYLSNTENMKQHNPKYAFFYGVTFSVALLTRITNVLPVVCGAFLIAIILLTSKEWKNIVENIFGGILGIIIPILPVIVYFWSQDALWDWWQSEFMYGIKYLKYMGTWHDNLTFISVKYFLTRYFLVYFPICTVLLIGKMKKIDKIVLLSILIGLVETAFFWNSTGYAHYAMIAIPNMLLIFLACKRCDRKKITKIILAVLCIYAMFCGFVSCRNAIREYSVSRTLPTQYKEVVQCIPEDASGVGAYNFSSFYLWFEDATAYKYIAFQDDLAKVNYDIKNEIRKYYESGACQWLVVKGEAAAIQDILEDKYDIVVENEKYSLYRWNAYGK
ncbi:MAG: glycosyltransferase family 39 protein [Lachnospiraceae bacterium]|nr:glycosyltransferase family 39 protein [Lachnospiraceae bacterium]